MIAFTLDSIPHRVFLVKYNKRKHVRNRKGNFIASHRARHRAALGNSETSVRPPKARACGPLLFSAPVFWLTSFSNFLYTPRKLPSFHPNISNTAINIYTQLPFSYLRRLQLFFFMQTLSTTPNITSAFDWTHSSLHLPLVFFFFFFFPFDTSVDVVTQSGRSTFSVSPWRRSIFLFLSLLFWKAES